MENKYTADLKTTGAVLDDAYRLLKRLYELQSIKKLEEELFENNLLLKSSKRRIENVYGSIKKRYLHDMDGTNIAESPLLLAIQYMNKEEAYFILYYHLCRADKLLYDFVSKTAFSKYIKGFLGLSNKDAEDFLHISSENHEEMKTWSERTYRDLKTALITVLLETGFLADRKNPIFNESIYISTSVLGYILYMNKEDILTHEDVYNHDDFKLLFQDNHQRKLMIKELGNRGLIQLADQEDVKIQYNFETLKEVVVHHGVRKD